MQVETYEINETTSDGQTDALDAEAVALIEKMGLAGQRRLVSSDGAKVAVMPYQAMTAEELAVYDLLFPTHDNLGEYSAGPIPMRVLQVAALATEREWFARMEVWHKRTGSAKDDPVLIGVTVQRVPFGAGSAGHWTRESRYLLARWGDALKPYRELLVDAAAIARSRIKSAIVKVRTEIEAAAAIADLVTDSVAVQWSGPNIHGCEPPRE